MKNYRSDAFASIHETEEALRDIGAIDKRIVRAFDEACLHRAPRSSRVGDPL
jgi:putative transcriptional regulator